jgi:hypothetical protein
MATRATKSPARKTGAAKSAKPAAKAAAKSTAIPIQHGIPQFAMPDPAQFAKYAKALTPEQAFELYKANSKMALEIINAAIESTAKVRRLQFEGEETARSMQKKAARHAAEAQDAQSLMVAGQSAAQEAVAQSMQYWGQMFELIADMQKRLFTLMESQMSGMPGAKEAKAAMAMLPDLTPAKDLVSAMQGVLTSGGSAFESMQRVMGDFTKFAQQSMPGLKR